MKTLMIRGVLINVLMFVIGAAVFIAISSAKAEAYSYFEENGYEEELALCVDLLRPSLAASAGEKVEYVVQDIDLQGPWYRFEIAATVTDVEGQIRIDGYRVGCKSNRWIESAQLDDRNRIPKLTTYI